MRNVLLTHEPIMDNDVSVTWTHTHVVIVGDDADL